MTIEIGPVDPFDDAAVDAWWTVYAAALRADRADDAVLWSLEETRQELQQASAMFERHVFIARLDGRPVGAAGLGLPLKDNLHLADIAVYVAPEARRAGVGSALLAELETRAIARSRRTFLAETSWAASAPADGTGHPGVEFGRRHGYALALGDRESVLELPVAEDLLDRLAEGAPDDGYVLRSWTGPVPEDIVTGWAELSSSLDTEAPMGDLDIEAATPDVAEIRESEELVAAQGRTSFCVVALSSEGEVAAYSQLVVSGDDSSAYQWGTLVRRKDRGHRLGMRVKLENLRRLQQELPRTPRVVTYNAESNEHMLAVNVALGFRPSGRLAELQKRIG
ncbi:MULTISPECIES: GNAT family N-acetyltransferase [unclassified Microbacterium]|uniref:GNAT family N-acetyltransferase n=1 Tax=unclassified Microbacterium TaxID=2609290 RepID=UPI00365550FD